MSMLKQLISNLSKQFVTNKPFDHIIIPNFLNEKFAEKVYNYFPEDIENKSWHKYYNPIELKYAKDDLENFPPSIKQYFYLLSMPEIIELFKKLSTI